MRFVHFKFPTLSTIETENPVNISYSPVATLNLFNDSISVNQVKRIVQFKGIYVQGKGNQYSGYFYDFFRDEASDAAITILVPPLIRQEMQPNRTVTVNGFVICRVINSSGSIQIQLTVTDLLEQAQNKYSEDDIKKIELMQQKAAKGYPDVYSWLKDRIINEEPFKIGIIMARPALSIMILNISCGSLSAFMT